MATVRIYRGHWVVRGRGHSMAQEQCQDSTLHATQLRANQVKLGRRSIKALIHIKIAFIFPKVANRMTFIQHAPHFRTQSERVGQCLKDVVTIGRPISIPTQGCQTKRVRGVVGKIKAAFQ